MPRPIRGKPTPAARCAAAALARPRSAHLISGLRVVSPGQIQQPLPGETIGHLGQIGHALRLLPVEVRVHAQLHLLKSAGISEAA
jgi:hypothetical protein